ncbi:MAG: hypothetical protein H0X51_09395 [Parachlamydiaceae bacterium]|nr:hypothetical protein [Parachlamydiaceae bacterium]
MRSETTEDLLKGVFVEGVNVDLREPTFCKGVLRTEKGGVISGPNIRIQGRKIIYTRQVVEGAPVCFIEAEEDLMLEFGDYIFVGQRLEYDFQTGAGVLYLARSGIASWYVGGDVIYLHPNGTYSVSGAIITTSDNYYPDWYVAAEEASLECERFLKASNVRFCLFDRTLFWLPSISLDIKSLRESPVKYRFGWGGRQGPRVGLSYEIFAWNALKTFLRLDYRLNRGLGGGLETRYRSSDRNETFETINYLARDSSIFHPNEQYRYRFQGAYHGASADGLATLDFTYDKLSDKYMSVDYADQSLDIEEAGRTQLDVRRQELWWITNFMARVRVNSFETVKQELPTLKTTWRPFLLGSTDIVVDNRIEASYLDFAYANNVRHVHDYNAVRVSYLLNSYRAIPLEYATLTPRVGSTVIFYDDGPQGNSDWVVAGLFGCNLQAPFHQYYGNNKHVIVPYADYQYYTFPTTSPNDHYIFDIEDGWYRLDMLRFGATQSFYFKDACSCMRRLVFVDLWANAFFDTETIHQSIPKVYSRVVLNPTLRLRHIIDTAWDFSENQCDHFNIRTEWTASTDFAVAAEYRHRDAYDWRKADHDNFVLDSFRSVQSLLHSEVSDRRDTVLLRFFYRFHPSWALEYEARHGWKRKNRTRYNEFEIDLLANLSSSMEVKVSYQHKESEDRFAVYFSVWPMGPEGRNCTDGVSCVSY